MLFQPGVADRPQQKPRDRIAGFFRRAYDMI
jgi:hypothetical protein